jgi:predicted amidohydrolase
MKAAAVQMDVKILAKEHNLDQVLSRLEQAAARARSWRSSPNAP